MNGKFTFDWRTGSASQVSLIRQFAIHEVTGRRSCRSRGLILLSNGMLCSVRWRYNILAVYVITATLKCPPFDHFDSLRPELSDYVDEKKCDHPPPLWIGYVFLPVEFRVKSNSANIRRFGVNARRNKYTHRTRNLHGTSQIVCQIFYNILLVLDIRVSVFAKMAVVA